MITTTLVKWGNSQGVIIPKSLCEQANLQIEDTLEIESDGTSINITPVKPSCERTGHIAIEEIFADWSGTYEAPSDWPSVGSEIDWGKPQGAEFW